MNNIHSSTESAACPGCGRIGLQPFYSVAQIPTQSMLLLDTADEAVSTPTGDLVLGFCPTCGLISNPCFDPATQVYSEKYEASQAFSQTFNAFQRRQALQLIERYDLRGKRIVELGCGQGEYLALLCELGGNQGVGFDPVYSPERSPLTPDLPITIIKDLYSERYGSMAGDIICCKMTLEHIDRPVELLTAIRRSIGAGSSTVVFFQLPNMLPILRKTEFWDIYYEHCTYYTPGSLARLFRSCGFSVTDLWTDYNDQYLMIEARAAAGSSDQPLALEEPPAALFAELTDFARRAEAAIAGWHQQLAALRHSGRRAALWGSGSKAVSFLTALGERETVACVVDINPFRQGKYMAGTGQPIVAPQDLQTYRPDVVIVMNPIYQDEIRRDLNALGLSPQVLTV